MTPSTALPPLRREVRVACDAKTAFELFTAHLGQWWPLATHSLYGDRATVAIEAGRVVERMGPDENVWGTILEWNPPASFRMSWHPGRLAKDATDVQVSFSDDGGGGTVVTLTHIGWERRDDATNAWRDYETGWAIVLDQYARLVTAQQDGRPNVVP